MTSNEELGSYCDVSGCPYAHGSHGHISAKDRSWRPENKLRVSQEAQDIAEVVLRSYDGLTAEYRRKAELEQQLIAERVAYSAEYERYLEIVRNFGELATL